MRRQPPRSLQLAEQPIAFLSLEPLLDDFQHLRAAVRTDGGHRAIGGGQPRLRQLAQHVSNVFGERRFAGDDLCGIVGEPPRIQPTKGIDDVIRVPAVEQRASQDVQSVRVEPSAVLVSSETKGQRLPIRLVGINSGLMRRRSMDPRGFPTSLPEFQVAFPDDAACRRYLEKLRWPDGFVCPKCGLANDPYRQDASRGASVLKCRECKANVSLTAGTLMQGTHTPLSTWFWAAYLVVTGTPGMSAVQFQRQLGLNRYETAFQILHKLRAGMVRPDREAIGGRFPVEVDETYVGGRTRGEGKGVHHQAIVVGAVEVRRRRDGDARAAKGAPVKRQQTAGRLRLSVVADKTAKSLGGFVRENVEKGSLVRTDGWHGYNDLRGDFEHRPMKMIDDETLNEIHLPMIHIVFANLKTWIDGTHHGVSQQHLQAYLNEFTFRFNRRFYPMTAFNSVLGLAAKSVPPTYEQLYSGTWEHPAA